MKNTSKIIKVVKNKKVFTKAFVLIAGYCIVSISMAQTPSFTNCATEGAICTFSGTKQVRYGANGIYSYKSLTGPVRCDNGVFGDPIYGVVKSCSYSSTTSSTPTPSPTPTTWTNCASEGATCTFSGTQQVRYGANNTYVYKTATGSIGCNNAIFGDPIYGVVKSCAYSSTTSSTPIPIPIPTPIPSEPFTKPILVNPVNPLTYGAKCDGVTNDAAAFQSALNSSDVLVPAGRTCVINSTVKISASNRHLECEAGAVIKQTNLNAASLFRYMVVGTGRMSGNSIVNCSFIGTNTVPPQANWNDNIKHYNIPVKTEDRVDNFFLAGNTFDRFWGQSMFQTYGGVDGGRGNQIVYNTFRNCAYYGPVLVAHQNGYIGHNTMVDCATGVENDDSGQINGGNIIEFNTLTCNYGYGGPDMGACTMLTGGAGGKSDNSGNIVRNNTISGTSNGQGPQGVKGSRLVIGKSWAAEGVIPAQYSNNICGPGCVITP